MTSPTSRPDVTVVVIVYNDEDRLERAVRSVLDQTLRSCEVVVVDDCSTDRTPEVAARLAAAEPRVRSVRLPENSGGCGRPRNVGMVQARGRYVMFLDSDDTLDRHACLNLLATAEQTGAELVCGRSVRHYVERGTQESWMGRLFRRQAVHESLSDEPQLFYDLLATNKMYARDFLTRQHLAFPEDRLYEDMLFATHAYLTANRIAVIPHQIYNWNIVEKTATLSISNRTAELRNMADRISISRDMDQLLAKYGTPELQLRKDIRFIEHDLQVHLALLPLQDADRQQALIDIAAPYLADLGQAAFTAAHKLYAIAAFMVAKRDLPGVLATVDFVTRRRKAPHLTTDLVEREGRVYWCDRHLDDPLGREVLDVTGFGLHDRPVRRLEVGSRLTAVESSPRHVSMHGELVNPLERFPADGSVSARLEFTDRRRRRRRFHVPVELQHRGRRIGWTADFDPHLVLRPMGFVDPVYSIRLELRIGGETSTQRIFAGDAVIRDFRLPIRPRLTTLSGDWLRAYRTTAGNLALRMAAEGRAARAGVRTLRRIRSTTVGGHAWVRVRTAEAAVVSALTRRATKVAAYHRVLTRLPVNRHRVVFESHMGKQYSDSPKYIFEELRRRGLPYDTVWAYADVPTGFPEDARLVRRGSWAYFHALATARFWVDNQGFPHDLRKRPETRYIQTWHGSAFKRMGFDEATIKQATYDRQQRLQQAIDRFDTFLIRSDHDARTLARGMRVSGELMPVGYPRNDALVTGGDPTELTALRERLGLTDDRRVLLYAPTFRPRPGRGPHRMHVPFDLDRFAGEFGDRMVLLVRPHYLETVALPPGLAGTVRSVAGVHDITPLMLITDALITDYSSVMFDYALLDRPMLFHVPDFDDYVGQSRGCYFDLAEHAPGPLTHDDEELFSALADLDTVARDHAERRADFRARFGEYDNGHAAKAVVDHFFVPGGSRG
ncbi:MAG TPA: CDP-glycerol glycerophosphotransferase family protein [Actinoplanes sp.]|nr:CDP-glycerol glycerophosphotransferase family protein [Actinoplanes sp.]